jgi:glycosyltransferase involved in cell wall biosynthesis
LKKKTGLPLQLQIHTDFLSPYFKKESLMNKLRARLAKFLVRRADGVRVVSERIKKSLEINISDLALNINVLPIFVDIGKMDNAPAKEDLRAKYPQFDFIILMASRLTREKNIGMAINAFVKIAESRPGIGLVIVGEGPEEKSLKFKVRSLKLEKNIFLEPWTNDLISYYKTADVFLLTSDYEGYGLTIVEAMACGLPIITTDVGCAGEIIKDKENGLIIPVKDEQALVNAVFKLVNDLELRNAVSNNAKQAVARFASNEKTLELYKKLSEEILTRKE